MAGKGPRPGGTVLSPNFLDWAADQEGLKRPLAAIQEAVKRYKQETSQASSYAALPADKRAGLIETYQARLAQLQAIADVPTGS